MGVGGIGPSEGNRGSMAASTRSTRASRAAMGVLEEVLGSKVPNLVPVLLLAPGTSYKIGVTGSMKIDHTGNGVRITAERLTYDVKAGRR